MTMFRVVGKGQGITSTIDTGQLLDTCEHGMGVPPYVRTASSARLWFSDIPTFQAREWLTKPLQTR